MGAERPTDEFNHSTVEHQDAPAPLHGEPALIIGAIVAVATAVLATVPSMPDWMQATLIAIVAVGGALGIRKQVTPGG